MWQGIRHLLLCNFDWPPPFFFLLFPLPFLYNSLFLYIMYNGNSNFIRENPEYFVMVLRKFYFIIASMVVVQHLDLSISCCLKFFFLAWGSGEIYMVHLKNFILRKLLGLYSLYFSMIVLRRCRKPLGSFLFLQGCSLSLCLELKELLYADVLLGVLF